MEAGEAFDEASLSASSEEEKRAWTRKAMLAYRDAAFDSIGDGAMPSDKLVSFLISLLVSCSHTGPFIFLARSLTRLLIRTWNVL